MILLKLFCYILTAYGVCNIIAFGSGPFKVFEWIRYFGNNIGSHFGKVFTCMMCLPTNFGIVFSLLDWFFIKNIELSPFNMIFNNTNHWFLAAICDAGFTSAIVWLIYKLDEYLASNTKTEYDDSDNENKIL